MSKNSGSITPTTVSQIVHKPLDFTLLSKKLTEYEVSLQNEYDVYAQKIKQELAKHERYEKALTGIDKKLATKGLDNNIKQKQSKYKAQLEKLTQSYEAMQKHDLSQGDLIDKDGCFLKVYQQDAQNQLVTAAKPYVYHYGIDPEHAKCLVGHIIAQDFLHPIEELLLDASINRLKVSLDAEAFLSSNAANKPYAHIMVLIDIFVRKLDIAGNMCIKHDGNGIPDYGKGTPATHTVVLWKTKEKELTLIDPNNADFSNVLVGKVLAGYKIVAGQELTAKLLYSTNDKPAGYQNYQDSPITPRDCTDIAVKVAFELEEHQLTCVSIDAIKQQVVTQISNQEVLNSILPDAFNTRALQSSDHTVRVKSKKIVDDFLAASQSMKPDHLKKIIEVKQIKTLEDVEFVTQLLGELNGFTDVFSDIFQ